MVEELVRKTLTSIGYTGWPGHSLVTVPASNVLEQPRNLDTGPGIFISLLELARQGCRGDGCHLPNDHDIRSEAAFRRRITPMADLLVGLPDTDRTALLGARPHPPETG